MFRSPRIVLLLCVLVLAVAACNGTGGDQTGSGPEAGSEGSEQASQLDADAAATVDGETIPAAEVDARVASVAESNPDVGEQIESGGEQVLGQIRASVLSQLIVSRVILDGAEELDALPDDDDIAQARQTLVEETGGEEQLAAAVEQAGLDEEQLQTELRTLAALENIEQRLLEEAGEEPADGDADPATPQQDPGQQVVQQWISERLNAIEVVVHPDYGRWEPQIGQVVPPGGAPDAPIQPEGGAEGGAEGGDTGS